MKKFRFTLQAMQTIREREEQTAMESYAQTMVTRLRASERLAEMDETIRLTKAEWSELTRNGAPAQDLVQFQFHMSGLLDRREGCIKALQAAELAVQRALQAMLLARQAREAVSKSRERQLAAHNQNIRRLEQRDLDELASQHHAGPSAWRTAS